MGVWHKVAMPSELAPHNPMHNTTSHAITIPFDAAPSALVCSLLTWCALQINTQQLGLVETLLPHEEAVRQAHATPAHHTAECPRLCAPALEAGCLHWLAASTAWQS